MARDTAALATVLPVLDELGVRNWRDQDWCKNLAYDAGQFTTNAVESTCDLFDGPTSVFSEAALADFDVIGSALHDAHVPVIILSRSPDIGGRGQIVFDLQAGMYDRYSYVYEPGYDATLLPDCDCITTVIDTNWYFVNEDWN